MKAKKDRDETILYQETTRPGVYTSSRHLWLFNYGERTSTRTLALGDALLGLSVTFGHTTTSCSAVLAFSVSIYSAMKRSALVPPSCAVSLTLGCSGHWSALIPNALRPSGRRSIHSLPCPPRANRAFHRFLEHGAFRQSRVPHARNSYREQDTPRAHNRLDALTSHINKGVQIGNRVVGDIVLSPTNLVYQEAVMYSAHRVVVVYAGSM